MRTFLSAGIFLFLCTALSTGAEAQLWGRVAGRVIDAGTGEPLPGVTVVVSGTNYGTASNPQGRYSLRIPTGRYALHFTFVGFKPQQDSVLVQHDQTTRLDAALTASTVEMQGVTVEGEAVVREAGATSIDPADIQRVPAPFKDGFRIVKLQPGVATNNELSNEYSVRGGGFNENQYFINGFEIYKPFRVRQGEQEGLGLVHPDLAKRMTLYAGGFPARYGGKLSSALDVQYLLPHRTPSSGSAYASLLDAGATAIAATADGRAGLAVAFRTARARHFFEAQELKGSYDPEYTDVQAIFSWEPRRGLEIEALGSWARHAFRLEPTTRKTFFGTFNNLQSLWVTYSGNENDGHETGFAGVRIGARLSDRLLAEHRVSTFQTDESERFDIRGSAVLFLIENPFESDPGTGEGLIPIGSSRQEDLADNRVDVHTNSASGRYVYTTARQEIEAGWVARSLVFDDRIEEKSILEGRSSAGLPVRVVVDSLTDRARFTAGQHAAYLQDVIRLGPDPNRLILTVGLRADYYTFNGEFTWSPRVSLRFRSSARTHWTGAWGIYTQAPTYRELRGVPEPGSGILGALNRNLLSQRAVQTLVGVEHFVPSRRLFLRGEIYHKALSRLISYEVQNVRVAYSGENDSRGYVGGFDLQVRGELVPGLESWLNYGFMVARERFIEPYVTRNNRGLLPRPTDQRHTISLFVQDYVPRDPSWKIGLRLLLGTGLPYTPPMPGPRIGGVEVQIPGPRHSARYPAYKRVDMGATKTIPLTRPAADGRTLALSLTGEILNVFDMVNVVAYTWVVGPNGIWSRIPTRLTERTFNIRAQIAF